MNGLSLVPYAALCSSHGQSKAQYYIRFSPAMRHVIGDAKQCYIMKDAGGKYLMIRTINKAEHEIESKPWIFNITYHANSKAAFINVGRLVSRGWLSTRLFDGRRCKCKKDRSGKIYICLDEMIEEVEA